MLWSIYLELTLYKKKFILTLENLNPMFQYTIDIIILQHPDMWHLKC